MPATRTKTIDRIPGWKPGAIDLICLRQRERRLFFETRIRDTRRLSLAVRDNNTGEGGQIIVTLKSQG